MEYLMNKHSLQVWYRESRSTKSKYILIERPNLSSSYIKIRFSEHPPGYSDDCDIIIGPNHLTAREGYYRLMEIINV